MRTNHKVTKWVKLTEILSAGSYVKISKKCINFWKEFSDGKYPGVYQVSLKKPKQLVHKDICYIGESSFMPKRISDLRASAGKDNKVTHHMCGVFIREEGIDIESVYVRCIIIEEESERLKFERYLHSEHKSKFGYKLGYAWEEASGGYKSCRIQTQANIKRLDSIEACKKVQIALNKRMEELKKLSLRS